VTYGALRGGKQSTVRRNTSRNSQLLFYILSVQPQKVRLNVGGGGGGGVGRAARASLERKKFKSATIKLSCVRNASKITKDLYRATKLNVRSLGRSRFCTPLDCHATK
jgi:hypothetical protein